MLRAIERGHKEGRDSETWVDQHEFTTEDAEGHGGRHRRRVRMEREKCLAALLFR